MKIIIVGCGKVGRTLAETLVKEGHDITVIDQDGAKVSALADRINVMGVEGNGISNKVQLEAGIKQANLLIAVTNADELNMLCCLIAKKTGNCHTIARIRNPEYIEEIKYLREELNLSMVINPEKAAAAEIAKLIKYPSAMKIDSFAKGRFELMKLKVPEDSQLHKLKISDVPKLEFNILICAIERGEEVIIPDGNTEILAGDKLSFITDHKNALNFLKKIGLPHNSVRSSMLIGGGIISYYLAKELEDAGVSVKIIEHDLDRCNELSELLPKAIIIHGDGSEQDLLLEEGIDTMDAVASLTGIDEENVMFSLYAASLSSCKLITKINRIGFKSVINSLNLGSIINPKQITADRILAYVRAMQNSLGSNIETLYKIVDDKAEALEFYVADSSAVVGIPLKDLKLKPNLLIATIFRDGKGITPNGLTTIEKGDTVVVVTTNTGFQDLTDILL